MPRVFVPHIPSRFDKATHTRHPAIDLEPAAAFGEVVFCVSPYARTGPNFITQAIREQRDALADFRPEDFIVCAGDPILIASAMSFAGKRCGGPVRVLRWDKRHHIYELMEVEL